MSKMKKMSITLFLYSTLFILIFASCDTDEKNVNTILIDSEYLSNTKIRINKNDPTLNLAFDQLLTQAERALEEAPFSVTHKEKLAPSGDKHDYASYSRYWWPDPTKPDGLPYIRRDGETFPGSQSTKESDRPRIGALGKNTEILSLAYFLTGEQKYAKKTAELLRVWFLDNNTRMNPNVNHAQCRPGHNTGTKSGVLDGRLMVQAMESSLLIEDSSELSDSEYNGLKKWAADYFEWLTTNKMALQEAKSKNNHGSYYDAQAIYFALYSGNQEAAKKIAQNFVQNRLYNQIEPDGSMPKEMARTRPLFYSIYNLQAMFLVAHLAEKIDIDIWQAHDQNSRLKAGLDYLVPYADSSKIWPHPTLKDANRMELYAILKFAYNIYNDNYYLEMTEKLPQKKRKIHISNLAIPLMR